MTKPKVLIVIPTLAKGGAERVVSILANNLSERGYHVSIALLKYTERAYQICPQVEVVYLNTGKRTKNILNRIYFACATFVNFVCLVRKNSPEFVISFTSGANTWTGIICNLLRVPYIISERTAPDRTINSYHPVIKKIVFELYKRSKAIVVPSEGILGNIKKSKSFKKLDNIVIINNPVSEFKNFSDNLVHPNKFILSVGRLHNVKGFDRLIEAFSLIKSKDIDLIILGEGAEREQLTSQINTLGLTERVFLPGTKDNVQDYYRQCEIFLLTSRNEGYPNVLIEAMSAGCASISFDFDFGPREIIKDGENGLLVSNNNIHLLAEAIDSILFNPNLKSKFAKNARAVGELNSAKNITAKWEQLILDHD